MGYLQIVEALVGAAILAAAGWAGHKVTADHYEAIIAKAQVESDKKVAAANEKAAEAAIDWQAWAEVQPAKIVYRDRKVADAFKAEPAWAAASIPAAVRVQLDAAAVGADAAASQPDSAVPAAAAASVPDERGFGRSFSFGARRIRELFSPSPSAGTSSPAGG